ncbi:DUF411 domain-containing protein [Alkalilimnicola ehrlichii MLHE-1]|uniref:Metal-binding protein n=1 Tax=Alkalilimnicola ehrlichii (strain ATCC BAA-1101 / DSM 17681 / MLHE-1) TaxID=187272 RepID=Q0A5A4_ALKEH|nr:DUF411 domain-containing protein [Alkalilimnicola ehrlichii]ABI57983.1 protein of unknown function DUF411 [Alkalilimnicola ehrlichii MLHE-1]
MVMPLRHALPAAVLALALLPALVLAAPPPQATVYKSPYCGCCTDWEDHLREHGFEVTSVERRDMNPVKQRFGITRELASCHTAEIDGYVIEGHVPAEDILRLLEERPERVRGLTVPGMPAGSPGMEVGHKDPYQVLTFDAQGRVEVYARYE